MTRQQSRRTVLVWAVVGAACSALPGLTARAADEETAVTRPHRLEGTWLASDSMIDGWRHVTRYDISVTGNRLAAVGVLILTSPIGRNAIYPPTVGEFSGTIEGNVLSGEVAIDWRRHLENGVTERRPMQGSVDFGRSEIVIQYTGPVPSSTSGTRADGWHDSDQTLRLRLIGGRQKRPFE
jgi:hypothetical protein